MGSSPGTPTCLKIRRDENGLQVGGLTSGASTGPGVVSPITPTAGPDKERRDP